MANLDAFQITGMWTRHRESALVSASSPECSIAYTAGPDALGARTAVVTSG